MTFLYVHRSDCVIPCWAEEFALRVPHDTPCDIMFVTLTSRPAMNQLTVSHP
jgi:hypothetical protein